MIDLSKIEPILSIEDIVGGKEWNKIAYLIKYNLISPDDFEKASEQKNKLGKHIVETLDHMAILSFTEIAQIIYHYYKDAFIDGLILAKPSSIKIETEENEIVYFYGEEIVDICWIPSVYSKNKQIILPYEDFYRLQNLAKQNIEGENSSILKASADFDFETIIKKAYMLKSSDIYITFSEDYYEVSFSINGRMVKQHEFTMTPEVGLEFIKRIKLDASVYTKGKFNADEHFQVQDARIEFPNIGAHGIDTRLAFIPDGRLTAMCLTARILERKKLTKVDFRELGYDELAIEAIRKASKSRNALFIASGITGSGKSTLISYVIASIEKTKRIYTIEDPIEYQIAGHNITQHQVYEPKDSSDEKSKKVGFLEYMKGLKRSAPDIVNIGEIRNDTELIKSIIEMSDAGQLVLSTIHTTSSFNIYASFEQTFEVPFRITVPLIRFSINQVLVDRLCDDCKVLDKEGVNITALKNVTDELPFLFKLPLDALLEDNNRHDLYIKGKGCPSCSKTGYKGRIPVYDYFSPSIETIEWLMGESVLPSKYAIEKRVCTSLEGVNKLQTFIRLLLDGKVEASEDILYNKLM